MGSKTELAKRAGVGAGQMAASVGLNAVGMLITLGSLGTAVGATAMTYLAMTYLVMSNDPEHLHCSEKRATAAAMTIGAAWVSTAFLHGGQMLQQHLANSTGYVLLFSANPIHGPTRPQQSGGNSPAKESTPLLEGADRRSLGSQA